MKVLTIEWLCKHNACYIAPFQRKFGQSCEISEANVLKWLRFGQHPVTKSELLWFVSELLYDDDKVLLLVGSELIKYLSRSYNTPWGIWWRKFIELSDERLAKAVVQVAERSPNI